MPRIAFWNLQRLGAGTDAVRRRALTTLTSYWDPDLVLTCELTTRCAYPRAQNLTYRLENPRQLCYGALDDNDAEVTLDIDTPDLTADYRAAGFKGGTNFGKLADRALGLSDPVAGIPNVKVFVIHAPAGSSSAKKVMAYVASGLNQRYGAGQEWIVVGDFNVTPPVLGAVPVPHVRSLIKRSLSPTHYYARTRKSSELDYALSNIPDLTVRTMRRTRWGNFSDHAPILLEF
jgi:hypothetical protein